MTELFIVWLATTGVFGAYKADSVDAACRKAEEKKGQVFRFDDPGVRFAIACSTPGCDFPGWATVKVVCVKEKSKQVEIPEHWEAR